MWSVTDRWVLYHDLDVLRFYRGGDRMVIDAAGNVGIGDSTPSYKLDVAGTGRFTSDLFVDGAGGGTYSLDVDGPALFQAVSGDAYTYVYNNLGLSTSDSIQYVDIVGTGAGDPYTQYSISSNYEWTVGIDNSDSDKFKISGATNAAPGTGDKLTIDSIGNVGIGTTTPLSKLSVGGVGLSSAGIYGYGLYGVYGEGTSTGLRGHGVSYGANVFGGLDALHATCTDDVCVAVMANGGNYGVRSAGTQCDFEAIGSGTNYCGTSSIRWKKNITEIDNALDKVIKLRGVYFNWNEEHGGRRDMGFIAEEIGEHIPEIVVYEDAANESNQYINEKGETKIYTSSMDYSAITPVLVEAIKEQQTQIEQLHLKIEEQDRKIKKLENKNI